MVITTYNIILITFYFKKIKNLFLIIKINYFFLINFLYVKKNFNINYLSLVSNNKNRFFIFSPWYREKESVYCNCLLAVKNLLYDTKGIDDTFKYESTLLTISGHLLKIS